MAPDYVELHCHSYFSLLDGASSPEALVERAAALGMPALALTDHDAVYGAVRFRDATRKHDVHAIYGAEVTLEDGAHLTLLVEDQRGWQNLCALITEGQASAPKGQAALPWSALEGRTAGLIALSGCRQGPLASALLRRDSLATLAAGRRLRELFGPDQCFVELQHHLHPEDAGLVHALVELAGALGLDVVATNNVHYAERHGQRLHDVLTCLRHHTTLDQAGALLRANSEYYLKPAMRMAPLFVAYPQALTNTLRIAERCQFDVQFGLQDLPAVPLPPGLTAAEHLAHRCQERRQALPALQAHGALVDAQLAHELRIIERAGLANYFLIVADIVGFCREQGIRAQGRGSAANSLVAYVLGISPVDALAHDLVFERFLSNERQVAPDIDLDIDARRREEVIQYVRARYGVAHAAMAATVITFRARSAARDVARVLGLPLEVLTAARRARHAEDAEEDEEHPLELLEALCQELEDVPRHLGIHNGGMILSAAPLATRLPTEPAIMPGRSVVQWDKESLEAAGIIKIDLLGLRALSLISDALALIAQTTGECVDLDQLPLDDPAVYDLITRADTIGVFQVESRAQAQVLPRLRPRCLEDLIVAISLIRPGPVQGQMVHPYLRRRRGEEPVTYAHPLLERALGETLGVILYQEQVLKVAHDLAGFTLGQGEQLRRALGAKRPGPALAALREAFLDGAEGRGVARAVAAQVFGQLEGFGSYAFAKSHSCAFATLVYQTAWLKRYHPLPFYTALLNNQPMGFWSPGVIVGDARRHGVAVLPVDLEHSLVDCSVEGSGLRIGLRYVKGMGEEASLRIVAAHAQAPFKSLADLRRRARLPGVLLEHLIAAGALDRWGRTRRALLWELGELGPDTPLDLVTPVVGLELPMLTPAERLAMEEATVGFAPDLHLLELYRPHLAAQGVLSSQELAQCEERQPVRVAGQVVVHQAPPTAKGHHFLTLEDEHGLVNVILRPELARAQRERPSTRLVLVAGTVQQQDGVVHLLARTIQPLG